MSLRGKNDGQIKLSESQFQLGRIIGLLRAGSGLNGLLANRRGATCFEFAANFCIQCSLWYCRSLLCLCADLAPSARSTSISDASPPSPSGQYFVPGQGNLAGLTSDSADFKEVSPLPGGLNLVFRCHVDILDSLLQDWSRILTGFFVCHLPEVT